MHNRVKVIRDTKIVSFHFFEVVFGGADHVGVLYDDMLVSVAPRLSVVQSQGVTHFVYYGIEL